MDRPRIGPPRRLAVTKLGRVGVVVAAIAGLLLVGGTSVSRWMVDWYHHRPEHQVAFRDIELVPPPPTWLTIGREGLLEQVRNGRKPLEVFSYFDLDQNVLLNDFRLNPWISRAEVATRTFPKTVTVSLVYREPVARVVTEEGGPFLVDREGVVLPRDDVDRSWAENLVEIMADNPPTEPEPGLAWPGDDPPGKIGPRSRVVQAARLARFFQDRRVKDSPKSPQTEPRKIYDAKDSKVLWVYMADPKIVVNWGPIQDRNVAGEPSNFDKWRWLTEKAGTFTVNFQKGESLGFRPDGIEMRRPPAVTAP